MGVQLDWQKDTSEQGPWPRLGASPPSPRGVPRWLGWLLLVVGLIVLGGALAVWRISEAGLDAAKADIQESLAVTHWTLQQQNEAQFSRRLDAATPAWPQRVMSQWDYWTASAQDAAAPTVEKVRLRDTIADTTVLWQDGVTGDSYRARRWFRLANGEWRWTSPRGERWSETEITTTPRLTLRHSAEETQFAAAILADLDAFTGELCRRYQLSGTACRFQMRWQLLAEDDLPPPERDLPLPTITELAGYDVEPPLFVVSMDNAALDAGRLQTQMAQLFPGMPHLTQLRLEAVRPPGAARPPVPGADTDSQAIVLPTPWLWGIHADSQPHPQWREHAERVLTGAVLRRAADTVLGSSYYVNAIWALHQALLAMESGLPELAQVAAPGVIAPLKPAPAALPDLGSLGAALQSAPNDLALTQLAGLVQYMQTNWDRADLSRLPQAMRQHGTVDALLQETLGVDEASFLAGWRQEQMAQPGSPLAELVQQLQDHMRNEASLGQSANWDALMRLYTGSGRPWINARRSGSPFGRVSYDESWAVAVKDIGAVEDTVWVEIEERDSQHTAVDLRFYRWTADRGWLRDAPDARFWGAERTVETEWVRWIYRAIDADAVAAVAPRVNGYVEQLAADLSLPLKPVTITVEADTLTNWAWVEDGKGIHVASPRNYLVDLTAGSPAESLRQEVALMMILRQTMHKADSMAERDDWTSVFWPSMVGVMRYELGQMDMIDLGFFDQMDAVVAQAVAASQPLDLSVFLALDPATMNDFEASYLALAVTYVLEEHGTKWIDPLFGGGLTQVFAAIAAEKGWDWAELEADWQRYLRARLDIAG